MDNLGHEAFNFFPDFGEALYGTFGIIARGSICGRSIQHWREALRAQMGCLLFSSRLTRVVYESSDGTVTRLCIARPLLIRKRFRIAF